MPLATLKEQVNTSIDLFDTFPLLVYPCRVYDHKRGAQGQLRCLLAFHVPVQVFRFRAPAENLITPGTNYAMFNDLGVYGTPGPVKRREPYNPTYAMRAMEKYS